MFQKNIAPADFRQVPNDVIRLDALTVKPQKLAPYAKGVFEFLRRGKQANCYLFTGRDAWERCKARLQQRGLGTAMVLPDNEYPASLKWPPTDTLVVAWPSDNKPFEATYRRKLELAQALVRDGVRFVAIQHEPEFLMFWAEGGRRQ